MKKLVLTITLVLTGVVAAPASGAITYVSQARSVSADGFVNGQFDGGPTYMANDFGVFNRTTSWTFSNGTGTAMASQFSRLEATSITVDELAECTTTGTPARLEGFAASTFDVTFALTTDVSFTLTQSHTSTGETMPGIGIGRRVRATLTGPYGTVFSWAHDLGANTWPTGSLSGFIPAGQYRLQVECTMNNSAVSNTTRGTASIAFVIPAPHGTVPAVLGIVAVLRRKRHAVAG